MLATISCSILPGPIDDTPQITAARTILNLRSSRTDTMAFGLQPPLALFDATRPNHTVVAAALVALVRAPHDDLLGFPNRLTVARPVRARVDRVGGHGRLVLDAHPLPLGAGALVRVARRPGLLNGKPAREPRDGRRGLPSDAEGLGILVTNGALRGRPAIDVFLCFSSAKITIFFPRQNKWPTSPGAVR